MLGREVDLRVTYSSATGKVTSRATVVANKVQPNGPGCSPTLAVAQLRLDESGRAQE